MVSTISKNLDVEVKKIQRHPLDDNYRHLLLDGDWVKVGGYKDVKKVLLIAYGIKYRGQRENIGYRLAGSENASEWDSFLMDHYRRGFKVDIIKGDTVDAGIGLLAASLSIYPHVPRHRCWVHIHTNIAQRILVTYRAA